MLAEVAASSTAVRLQPTPKLEGCWCLPRLISEGSAHAGLPEDLGCCHIL